MSNTNRLEAIAIALRGMVSYLEAHATGSFSDDWSGLSKEDRALWIEVAGQIWNLVVGMLGLTDVRQTENLEVKQTAHFVDSGQPRVTPYEMEFMWHVVRPLCERWFQKGRDSALEGKM